MSEMKLIMENWNKYLLKEADEGAVANAIVGMFLSKRFDYDDIVKIIRDYKWEQFRRYGRRF